jgi:curli biogenesis system outer membrane secretion channel CsgG
VLSIRICKSFHKSLTTAALTATLCLAPLATTATQTATAPVATHAAWCPRLPEVPQPPATLTKVDVTDEGCTVYVFTAAQGSQTMVVCVDAKGTPRVTVTPLGAR